MSDVLTKKAAVIDEVKEKLAQLGLALKDSPPGFDPSAYASYNSFDDDEDGESAADDDQSFAEDEQL